MSGFIYKHSMGVNMAEINVSGIWTIHQGNGSSTVVTIVQDNQQLSGSAAFDGQTGAVSGTIAGRDFLITVKFSGGDTNEYSGTFNIKNRLTGIIVNTGGFVNTSWISDKVF